MADYTLLTLKKGLHVLETLGESPVELTLTELSEQLQESTAVMFRILKTLEERGYVQQRPDKKYSVGLRLWELASKTVNRMEVVEVARPTLKWLVQMTGETAALSVARGSDILYLDIVEGSQPIRVHAEHGNRAPIYATASGKVILAHREGEFFERVVKAGLRRLTARSITGAAQLRRALREIRRSGLSVNRGEQREDTSAVAGPVFDAHGQCIAAISVSVPTPRLVKEHLDEIKRHVKSASAEVSTKLGHTPAARKSSDMEGNVVEERHARRQRLGRTGK